MFVHHRPWRGCDRGRALARECGADGCGWGGDAEAAATGCDDGWEMAERRTRDIVARAGVAGVGKMARPLGGGARVVVGGEGRKGKERVLIGGRGATAVGLDIGMDGAWARTGILESMLFNVNARDPVTFFVGPILLTIVAVTACWIPARRATRVDPVMVLKQE